MSTPSVAIEQEGDHYTLLLVSFEQTLDNALDDKNDDSLPKAIKKVLDEAEDETPKVFTDFFFFLMTHLRALMEQGKTDVVLRVLGVFKGTAPPSDYHQELLNLGLDGFLGKYPPSFRRAHHLTLTMFCRGLPSFGNKRRTALCLPRPGRYRSAGFQE